MDVGRLHAAGSDPLDAGGHGGVGGAPAHEQQLGVPGLVVHLDRRDVGGDPGDLVPPEVDHALVVDALVGDVPAAVRLLEAADAVLQPGQAGRGPRAGQGLGVAHVGPERLGAVVVDVVGLGGEAGLDRLEGVEVGQAPGLGPVGQVAVGEHDHRRAVLHRQPDGLDGDGEAVARRLGRQDRQRRLPVAAVHGVQEVGLLGLGRQARSRARRAGRRRSRAGSSRLMARPIVSDLRSRPGPLVVVTPRAPPKDGAQGGADAGDLVLGLEGPDAELLAPAQLVQDVRRRGDRVAARGRAGSPARRVAAIRPQASAWLPGDLDVLALLEGGRADLVVGLEQLGGLAEVVTGPEGPGVGLGDLGPGARSAR